jgi:MerR family transcriptional regulator, mercuric resistance operon regulatory protein
VAQTYTISRLAAAADVNVETVRYYQRRRLMPEPARPARGTRLYTDVDAQRLRFIKRAQLMGFALAEIENLLELRARRSCRTTRDLAASKLQSVDARIRELRQLRKELAALVAQCDTNASDSNCPILDRLAAGLYQRTNRSSQGCSSSAQISNAGVAVPPDQVSRLKEPSGRKKRSPIFR